MKVIISRKQWLRGEGGTVSRLLRKADDKMCCLGFACIQSGLAPIQIREHMSPINLLIFKKQEEQLPWAHIVDVHNKPDQRLKQDVLHAMMAINDAPLLQEDYFQRPDTGMQMVLTRLKMETLKTVNTESERESLLIMLGKKVGLELEFVD